MTTSEEVLDLIFESLQDATARRTPFTLGYLGTVGIDGGPRVRAVILRRFDPVRSRIMFATDSRSEKVPEIRRSPRVALTMSDDQRAVQLRVEGHATLVDDTDERVSVWETLGRHSRELYSSPAVPGTPVRERPEVFDDDATAFDRFAWVGVELERLDWLDLSAPRHARWRFVRRDGGWSGQSVVP
ncbi:pyridoxamine 5'-phosphate oxidase family protein [Rhodococcus sp. SJ-2]